MTERSKDTIFYRYYNNNPKGLHTGDCAIRAIALATNQTWDKVLDDLVALSHESGYSVSARENFDKYLISLGFQKCKQPRKSDNTKYTGKQFIKFIESQDLPFDTTIVASIGWHHVTAFVDYDGRGVRCWDTWDTTDRCVGVYYIKM